MKSIRSKLSFNILLLLFMLGAEVHGQCYQYLGADNGANQASPLEVRDLTLALDSLGTPYISCRSPYYNNDLVVLKDSLGIWVPLDTGWFYNKSAFYPNITVDKNGSPCIVYSGYYNKLSVVRYSGAQWDTIGMQGFTPAYCSEPKLIFDKNNIPYVIFIESSSKISVMKYDGTSWGYVGPAGFSPPNSKYLNISIDTSGVLYTAYRDGITNKATVMQFDGTDWINVGPPGISAGSASFVTLVLDNSGTPYIGYSDSLVGQKTSVNKFDGISWVYVGTQGFSPTTSNYQSIAIDPSGMPIIAFGEGNATGGNGPMSVMKFNGSTWSFVGLRNFSQGPAWSNSFAVSHTGTPIVAIADIWNNAKPTVMQFNGSNWGEVEKSGFSPGLASHLSMTVDNASTPFVAFADINNGKKASVMYYNGSVWSNVGPTAITSFPVKNLILLHDKSNALYLFYQVDSISAPTKINVLKYSGGLWTSIPSPGSGYAEFGARFSPNDTLYIAYSDSAYYSKLTVKKFNGSSWTYIGTHGFTSAAAYKPSIDISPAGVVYVSYINSYLWVTRYIGGSWVQYTSYVDQAPDYGIIRVGKSERPFIMDSGGTGPGGISKLFQADNTGNWTFLTGGGTSGPSNVPKRIDLTLDENENQYYAYPVSYYPTIDSVSRRLRIFARMDNQIFNLASPSTRNSIGAFNFPNLCFDTLGTLYAGYQDGGAVVEKLNTIRLGSSSIVDQYICAGDTALFSLTAYSSSMPLSYQWQMATSGSGTYSNLNDDSIYTGVSTPSLTIANVTISTSLYHYRCAITNSCYTYYAPVKVHVENPYVDLFSLSPSGTVCLTTTPYTLTGEYPPGGTYSGYNVSGNSYTADSIGTFAIAYTYTNSYGCTSSDTATIETILPTVAVTAIEPACGGTGSLTVTGSGTPPFVYQLDTVSQSSSTFSGIFSGIDYNACMTNSYGCHACTNIILADSCDLVWPGDANDDLVADNLDILAIGIGMDTSATARTTVTNNWNGYPSFNWPQTLAGGSNYKHIDCNGDGTIDLNDTLAVNLNFSLTHAFSSTTQNNQERLSGSDLYFVSGGSSFNSGDYVDLQVWLGSALSPLSNLYGIAFNISYDAPYVQPGSEHLTFPVSWIGTPGVNAIKISEIDALASTAYGAISRITHTNTNGYGKIADFKFQLKNAIPPNTPLYFSFSRYQANDSIGTPIVINTSHDSILINPTSGIKELNNNTAITVAPNPFSSQTTIIFSKGLQNGTIKIKDVLGKEARVINFSGDHLTIEKRELQSGIYFIEIYSKDQLIDSRKLVVQ